MVLVGNIIYEFNFREMKMVDFSRGELINLYLDTISVTAEWKVYFGGAGMELGVWEDGGLEQLNGELWILTEVNTFLVCLGYPYVSMSFMGKTELLVLWS